LFNEYFTTDGRNFFRNSKPFQFNIITAVLVMDI